MNTSTNKISTNVRVFFSRRLWLLRIGFRLGSLLRPQTTARLAGELFGTPLPGSRLRAARAAAPDVLESEFELRGDRIRTYVWGDPATQPYVLFAHGWSSHGSRFNAWVERMRESGYAAVAFDQPAHGNSSGRRSHLPAFVDTLLAVGERFGPAAGVVGHSLGAAATALALTRGLQARSAVLIAASSDPVAAAFRFAHRIGLTERVCREMMTIFERSVGVTLTELQGQNSAHVIGRPALIVHDLEDQEVPWEEGERYARHWPRARMLTTQGLGHSRIVDDEDVILAGLGFLSGDSVGERIVSSPNLPYGVA